jgi:hypothetical protein
VIRQKQSRPNIDAGRAAGTGFQSSVDLTLAFVSMLVTIGVDFVDEARGLKA